MAMVRTSGFQLPQRQLRAELSALALAVCGAIVIGVFDIGVAARASEPTASEPAVSLLDARAAEALASEQGLVGTVRGDHPAYSLDWDRDVWRVEGEQLAVIDARTGDLLEVRF